MGNKNILKQLKLKLAIPRMHPSDLNLFMLILGKKSFWTNPNHRCRNKKGMD